MRHDWILDVLSDLRRYAQENRLGDVADGTEALLRLARAEIGAQAPNDGAGEALHPPGAAPDGWRPH